MQGKQHYMFHNLDYSPLYTGLYITFSSPLHSVYYILQTLAHFMLYYDYMLQKKSVVSPVAGSLALPDYLNYDIF